MLDFENIIAGVDPGGSNKVYEARILICCLFNLLDKPLSKIDINNILQYQGLVNYFTFSQAFNDLIKDKQVIIYEDINKENEDKLIDQVYILTDKGKKTAEVFRDTIAATVKEKISFAATQYFVNLKSLKDNIVKITKVDDGYMVSCRVKDIGSDLITINIFAPDKETSEKIKKNFVKGSLQLYQYIFDFLTS